MFIANLNHNNDSPIGEFAGNRLSWTDVIRPTTTNFGKFKTWFLTPVASTLIIRSWLIYFYNRCHENMKLRVLRF